MIARGVLLALLTLTSFAAAARAADDLVGAPAPLAAALKKLMADEGYWASTRTSRYFGRDGKLERTDVERYDPSVPDGQQWKLLLRDGRPPTVEEERSWRRTRGRG
jgi:hypothetical protein